MPMVQSSRKLYMRNKDVKRYIFYMQKYEESKSCYKYCDEITRKPYLCYGLHIGEYDAFKKAVDQAVKDKYYLIISDINALQYKVDWLTYLKNSKREFGSPTSPITKNSLHFLINYAELHVETLSRTTAVSLNKAKKDIKEKGRYITKQGKLITKLGSPDILSIQKKAAVVHSLKAKAWLGKKGKVIRELRTLGWTFQKIATHLNDLEVPTRKGSVWTKSSIHKIIIRESTNEIIK